MTMIEYKSASAEDIATLDLPSMRREGSPNIFFIGSKGSKALAFWRAVTPAKYVAKSKSASTMVMFGRFTKEVVDWADIIVLQRIAGPSAVHLARYIKLAGKMSVFDLDDDIFNYPDSPEYQQTDVQKISEDVFDVMKECDVVGVTEESLAASIRERLDKPIYILPNCLDFEFWDAPKDKNYSRDGFIIGWTGGHYHVLDLQLLVEPMSYILDKYKEIKFAAIGDCPKELTKKYEGRVLFHPFVNIDQLPDLMYRLKYDIALAPLYGNTFANSRSNARLLIYSAMSTPTIASDFGPYHRSYKDKFPMVVVDDKPESWIKAIEKLIKDKKRREYLGKAARAKVEAAYGADKMVMKWLAMFRDVRTLKKLREEIK
jgi:glycosyltransferase involved in cell wall biosynthesis